MSGFNMFEFDKYLQAHRHDWSEAFERQLDDYIVEISAQVYGGHFDPNVVVEVINMLFNRYSEETNPRTMQGWLAIREVMIRVVAARRVRALSASVQDFTTFSQRRARDQATKWGF